MFFAMRHQLCVTLFFIFLSVVCHAVTFSDIREAAAGESRNDTVFLSYRPHSKGPLMRTYVIGEFGESFTAVDVDTVCDCDRLISWLPPTALSTNMLYDCLVVPNIGIKMAATDRITVAADWMGTWLNDSKHHYYRIYGGDFDLKYRIGGVDNPRNPFSGHHVGLYASLVYYDIQRGVSHRGVMSSKYNYAVGISYTYSLPVARHFNIDFSLGLGYMWGKFKRHTPIDDHDVWLSTHRRSWIGPTRAEVSLVWVFGNGVYNVKKGGGR